MTNSTTLYCYVHPDRETALRCNNCERPICASCAVRTPTGYRCKECVRNRQKTFDTAEWYDFISAFIVGSILSAIGAALVSLIGGIGFFGYILIAAGAPTVGVIITEGIRKVTGKRRSRPLFITAAISVVVGALLVILFQPNMFSILFQIIYLVIVVPLVYTRLSGIQLFR